MFQVWSTNGSSARSLYNFTLYSSSMLHCPVLLLHCAGFFFFIPYNLHVHCTSVIELAALRPIYCLWCCAECTTNAAKMFAEQSALQKLSNLCAQLVIWPPHCRYEGDLHRNRIHTVRWQIGNKSFFMFGVQWLSSVCDQFHSLF